MLCDPMLPTRAVPLLLLGCLLGGCQLLRSPSVPMTALHDPCPPTTGPRVLLVLLPGTGDTPDDLVRRGMVAMVRERQIAADVIVADAHFGYYRTRQTITRLWHDLVAPALARDYDGVWLAGVSIGGLGCLLAAAKEDDFPAEILTGLLPIAPVLAPDDVVAEVEAAGGLLAWQPTALSTDHSRRLLAWLRGYGDAESPRPQLFLGIGSEDEQWRASRLLAPLLPESQVIVRPGGHTWQPWLEIWAAMLDRAPLPRLEPHGRRRG